MTKGASWSGGGRPLAVITGASSGLGESFAKVLAGCGHDVLLIARRAERLQQLCLTLERDQAIEARALAFDLSEPSAPAKVAAHLDEIDRPAAVLVNNAGYGIDGRFLDTPWPDQAAMLKLMLETPAELVHRLLPAMLAAGRGRVITMASMGGMFYSTPHETLYGPIKRFGIAFSRTLAEEYRGTGVTFTAVCPGLTRTEMMDHGRPAVAKERVPAWLIASPDTVARSAWKAAKRGDLVFVPGLVNKATASSLKIFPTDVMDRVLTAVFDRVTGVS
jgi:short-subunit dehydrogenase